MNLYCPTAYSREICVRNRISPGWHGLAEFELKDVFIPVFIIYSVAEIRQAM